MLMRDGVEAQALVLEKKIYASGYSTGKTNACRYRLRVKFEDGSTTEVKLRVWRSKLARANVGDLIPVRYDPADHSKIEIDGKAIQAQRDAAAHEVDEQAIAEGERKLDSP
jgi:hypothetical protein